MVRFFAEHAAYGFTWCSTCTWQIWVGIYMNKEEHSIGHVYAIKGVNKRDIHVAQSAFAQTKTINHK